MERGGTIWREAENKEAAPCGSGLEGLDGDCLVTRSGGTPK